MEELILNNIEIIELWFYIIQIIVIIYWIFIWYKNYHELLRKNNIEESPYISIVEYNSIAYELTIKNMWKTPMEITKISFIKYGEEDYDFNLDRFNDVVPNEEITFILLDLDPLCADKIKNSNKLIIYYKNHIKESKKELNLDY